MAAKRQQVWPLVSSQIKRINTSGMQFEVKFVDLDNDQRLDFYTPAAQIGVRSIIRALIAGTANLELQFY